MPLTPEPKTLSRANLPPVQPLPTTTLAEAREDVGAEGCVDEKKKLDVVIDPEATRESSSSSSLKLEVSLGGSKLGTLSLSYGEDVERVCQEFVAAHRLRAVFQAPLEGHVELMVHMAKTEDAVDVCDLL